MSHVDCSQCAFCQTKSKLQILLPQFGSLGIVSVSCLAIFVDAAKHNNQSKEDFKKRIGESIDELWSAYDKPQESGAAP